MDSFLTLLRARIRDPSLPPDPALDDALGQLDHVLSGLAPALEVTYVGPFVGLGAGREAFRLVVSAHTETVQAKTWGARVCSAGPHQNLHARWTLRSVARLRKPIVLAALPAFLAGYYDAVVAAGKAPSKAGLRLLQLTQALDGTG